MVKFPSQRKIQYQTGALSNDAYTTLTSGGATGDLNIPKDLSLLNRRGYSSTTRKGVPLVYRCKVDFHLQNEDGVGLSAAVGTDFTGTLKIDGVQNNWVMRNAAVSWHAARENMFRRSGIKKGARGAYAGEIRYNFDATADNWLVPIDGDGDAFTGGTWDVSTLTYAGDDGFTLKLTGVGDDEEADAFAGSVISIGHSYLLSRANQIADTNPESEEGPAQFSVLKHMHGDFTGSISKTEDVTETARGEQDNPPYEVLDISDSGDTSHDITESVELGRAVAGLGNTFGSVVVDIPFGICRVRGTVHDAADTNITPSGLMNLEVLDIYEMQG